MIVVRRAPAFATIQDRGRTAYMSSGVPRAGAMDLPTLDTLNALLGNPPDSAAIECALTGGELELTERVTFAIAGSQVSARLNGREIDAYRAHASKPGDILTVDAISSGRFSRHCRCSSPGTFGAIWAMLQRCSGRPCLSTQLPFAQFLQSAYSRP